jgi:hypothetical protein
MRQETKDIIDIINSSGIKEANLNLDYEILVLEGKSGYYKADPILIGIRILSTITCSTLGYANGKYFCTNHEKDIVEISKEDVIEIINEIWSYIIKEVEQKYKYNFRMESIQCRNKAAKLEKAQLEFIEDENGCFIKVINQTQDSIEIRGRIYDLIYLLNRRSRRGLYKILHNYDDAIYKDYNRLVWFNSGWVQPTFIYQILRRSPVINTRKSNVDVAQYLTAAIGEEVLKYLISICMSCGDNDASSVILIDDNFFYKLLHITNPISNKLTYITKEKLDVAITDRSVKRRYYRFRQFHMRDIDISPKIYIKVLEDNVWDSWITENKANTRLLEGKDILGKITSHKQNNEQNSEQNNGRDDESYVILVTSLNVLNSIKKYSSPCKLTLKKNIVCVPCSQNNFTAPDDEYIYTKESVNEFMKLCTKYGGRIGPYLDKPSCVVDFTRKLSRSM